MLSHREAAEIIRATAPAWAGPRARRLVQAVAWMETNYGHGWAWSKAGCPELQTGHNWGAIQGEPGVLCTDTDANGRPYQARYRIYASDEEGAAALWAQMVRRPVVVQVLRDDALDAVGMARAMSAPPGYFELPVSRYAKALRGALDAVTRGL